MATLFVPLDVNYAEDDKIIDVGPMAELLYIRGLAFAKRSRQNGQIGDSQLPIIAARIHRPRALAARLIDVGLWERNGTGLYIRAWLKRNPPADELVESGAAGAHKRWHLKRDQPNPDCDLCIAEGLIKP
jgi:hypothetical protein